MSKKYKFGALLLLGIAFVCVILTLTADKNWGILAPAGEIADKQANLLYLTAALSLIIVLPVFALTFWISWKYRETNTKAKYSPEWDGNRTIEFVWWLIPIALITYLAVVTYNTSHSLDPFRPLNDKRKPLTVEVIALEWRWLFIYPEQRIASVNYLYMPKNYPVKFKITSDAPMNSFWIPQLGGQIYAMSGMATELNLKADKVGSYEGASANLSGRGFANMRFDVKVSGIDGFHSWISRVANSQRILDNASYSKLSQPSANPARITFGSVKGNIFDDVVKKYQVPSDDVAINGVMP